MAPKLSSTSTQNYSFGVYHSGSGIRSTIAEDVTEKTLKAGFRHIDSAAVYGNERECVSAVEKAGLKRSEVFLTTKILPQATGYEAAKQSIEDSLKKAKTDYFDLRILLHAPFGGKEGRRGAWRALAEAQKAGKARSIGVSNFGLHHLEDLEEYIKGGDVGRIEVDQYELHPWLGRADLRGVVIEAYSPLARGTRMDEPVLRAISEKHKKSPAQILIRWSLQKGFVPLPKSATPERILENANVFDFELDEDDMQSLHTDDYAPSTWDPTIQQDYRCYSS
ncbi:aldo/keto reductase [Aspergillus oryzae 3.042]|uniref:D-xylose reductase [NAD(P)H] n=1 Tax=Aspergillus oryzae (strain 3.042) TaxID=1160506 RepID=I8A8B3_ASPO3|nr:aldo/keto reductase [Aspergillus oryzae 3.042]|eukprot:EIT81437.1 aldo/keto reductase [Aspergillus oryzae 3.042]